MEYKELMVVLGLSRSGTTLLASLLHAHPDIELRFEPWHSMQPRPPVFTTIDWFDSFYSGIYDSKSPKARFGGFKETFGGRDAVLWTSQVLENIHKNSRLPIRIVVIVRDPVHAYLSNIGGYQKYWDQGSKEFVESEDDFLKYALPENNISLQALIDLQQQYGGVFVSYRHLVEQPASTMKDLVGWFGLNYGAELLQYYKYINMSHVMGDKGVSENPQLSSYEYYERRAKEAEQFESNNQSIKTNESLRAMRGLIDYIDTKGVTDDCNHHCLLSPDSARLNFSEFNLCP